MIEHEQNGQTETKEPKQQGWGKLILGFILGAVAGVGGTYLAVQAMMTSKLDELNAKILSVTKAELDGKTADLLENMELKREKMVMQAQGTLHRYQLEQKDAMINLQGKSYEHFVALAAQKCEAFVREGGSLSQCFANVLQEQEKITGDKLKQAQQIIKDFGQKLDPNKTQSVEIP